MAKLIITPLAREDMCRIGDYIRDTLQNPGAALRLMQRFRRATKPLQSYPEMGTLLQNADNLSIRYRYLVCGSYLIFYHVENDSVHIDRVIYSRRDYLPLLFGDQLSEDE